MGFGDHGDGQGDQGGIVRVIAAEIGRSQSGRVGDAVSLVEAEDAFINDTYYTIQGIRVNKPVKGLYIHNGKKILVK